MNARELSTALSPWFSTPTDLTLHGLTLWPYSCYLLPPRNEPGTNNLHLSNKFDSDYFK